MKYTHLRIGLENCENIEIEQKYVEHLTLARMQSSICIFSSNENEIREIKRANKVLVEINKDADVKYGVFGHEQDRYTVFDRIQRWRDICSIDLIDYNSETLIECYTPWEDGINDEDNALQKVFINDEGNLVISIKEDNKKD